MANINKILVANRGEIALRIMRSAREMGISTVAVFSTIDRRMPFVQFAAEAVHLGPAPSRESYLCMDKILQAARKTGSDAIHPGYGFLSENPEFAQAVEDAGLLFIGPSASSIRAMGNKLAAKRAAEASGVPLVPGTARPLLDTGEARKLLREIGLPVLIKASAGGGGKGMRVVEREEDLETLMQQAKGEALNAFGDESVFLEKYMQAPRHIEIQILGDRFGNYVHLFERECSIQRRHQKLIEEAPSSLLSEELRSRMGACAVEVARACGYFGAGTVEFLVDEQNRFYFLEMNTRLQVEHPVTEWITGLDLVKEQIRICRGEELSFRQEELQRKGHAIELRVCAEDPWNQFLPQTGRLDFYQRPQGIGIRVDDGYEQGMEIPVYYDSLIAKLVVWGRDRGEAIDRLRRAIGEFLIRGVPTTLEFGSWLLEQPAFLEGRIDTHFLSRYFEAREPKDCPEQEIRLAAHLAAYLWEESKKTLPGISANSPTGLSAWTSRRNLPET